MKKLMKRFILACLVLCVGSALVVFFLTYVNRSAIFSEIKDATEEKISSLLNARVRISDMNLGFLSGISLKNLTVDEEKSDALFSFLDVKRIVLRLNPFGLIFRRPELQNTIIMDTPNFKIRVPDGVQAAFSWDPFFSWGEIMLQVQNGKAQYMVPNTDFLISLSRIDGKIETSEDKKYCIDFQGNVSEAMMGAWQVTGCVDQPNRDVSLSVQFSDLQLSEEVWGPFSDISGTIHISTEQLVFDEFHVRVRNMHFVLNGVVDHYLSDPVFDVSISIDNYHLTDVARLTGDCAKKQFELLFDCFGRELALNGFFDVSPDGVRVHDAETDTGYAVEGTFSLRDEEYQLSLSNESKAVDLDFSYRDKKPTMRAHLDHVRLFGFDVVLNGVVDLAFERARDPKQPDRVVCTMKTDLFIFNYLPLDDFAGSFVIGKEGFTDIMMTWGSVYHLAGVIHGDEAFTSDLKLQIDEFAIDDIEQFMTHPLSIDVRGKLSGEIAITGAASEPHFQGDVRIVEGLFSSFSYDEAILQFDGDVSTLYLRDSYIVKKGRKFFVRGNIDCTARNILNDVVIQTSERIIIWQGWDIGQSHNGEELLVEKRITDNLTLEAKTAPVQENGDQFVQGTVGLEYAIDKSKAVRVQAHEDEKGETVDIRHTITF